MEKNVWFKRIELKKNKIAKIYEYIKLSLNFPVHRKHSYGPRIKKMTEVAKKFCIVVIIHNSNLSTRKIIKLLSEYEL